MELVHRLVSSRIGTASLALLVALAAGVAVLVYVDRYRATVDTGGTPATVLVAKKPIPKGMSAAAAASAGYFEAQALRRDQLSAGAVVDPAALRNLVATRDLLPGEQVTTDAFGASAGGVASRLTGDERAIAITVDASHGLANQLQQGDRVDVLASFDLTQGGASTPAVVKTLLQDVPVLALAHESAAAGSDKNLDVLLQVGASRAAQVAYAAENGKVWLVLRPRVGAPAVAPSLVTLQSLLQGSR